MDIKNKYNKLGSVELFVFTYCSTVTIGFIFLPYISNEEIRSAWLKVIVAVFPFLLFIYLFKKVTVKHDTTDIFGLFKKLSPSWIFYIVIAYFFISSVYSIFFGTKSLIIIVQTYLMQDTLQWKIGISFLFVVALSVFYGIHSISRMLVVIFFHEIILLMSLFLFLFSDDFRWINVPPTFGVDAWTFMKSSLSDLTRYGGIVALLAYVPYVNKDVKIFRPITFSLIMVMITYALICIVTLGVFGFEQALTLLSPVTALMQTTTSPTGLFERLDLFFLTVWVMSFFKIGMIYLWFSSKLLVKIIPVKPKWEWIHISIISIAVMVLVVLTPSITNLDWRPYNMNMLIYSLTLPIMLFLYLLMRRKKNSQGNEQNG
ncbi:GerAB/ArcD/ProY family transporter [Evansella cellulosilytica]|uniref:Spore germination protein n=1 Tax=Evansella cellulosilytica (strain ATCC 21833 / DSM 2522 / FERM P-1141 / JCM 9156 / N-4) TaxID=649639 RepID=E6U2A1_EVAC2|nr:GerAB/ArcD/ProY family transporter [Evansella cellulosilytica]ADU30479.1 spore germination protein [Evansella cellulosilytica DSM 2522]